MGNIFKHKVMGGANEGGALVPAPDTAAALGLGNKDLARLAGHGKTERDLKANYEIISGEQKFVPLLRAATKEDGIVELSEDEIDSLVSRYETIPASERATKFSPMSGAASRMFGFLDRVATGASLKKGDEEKFTKFIRGLDDRTDGAKQPFIESLKTVLAKDGLNLYSLLDGSREDHVTITEYVLYEKGLNYSKKPKALIPFHLRNGREVLALEEQMKESLVYSEGVLNITASPEHRAAFKAAIDEIKQLNPALKEVQVNISEQNPSTDSIAINPEKGEIVRDKDGRIAFFPAGHGSLVQNIPTQFPSILRNVDNLPRSEKAQKDIEQYHKAFAVILADFKARIKDMVQKIDSGAVGEREFLSFVNDLKKEGWQIVIDEGYEAANVTEKREIAKAALTRPVKIVGVVANQGEPGGGPFVINYQGNSIISIVEKDEISPEQKDMMKSGEYFNPVDIMVDAMGNEDLTQFVNKDRFFIVEKPYNGQTVRRMEHPGLWNGAMDGYNGLFVVMPISTFAPVKEVVDLQKDVHQLD